MIPAIVVLCYLAIVVYIGIFAFRKGKDSGEDYFLASRSLGQIVFLLSLFGTNMTAFAILGSSGMAYNRGIGVYGLMASSSGLVIPLTIFVIGTRLWALGKRYGHMTQVQYFRDRWECSGIGTFIFALTAAMLVPYLIIGTMGGGATLEAISTMVDEHGQPVMEAELDDAGQPVMEPATKGGKPLLGPGGAPVMQPKMVAKHWVPYWLGALIVALVVMSYVFFGGMRGTAWVNTFQVVLFLCFGTVAFVLLSTKLGGFGAQMDKLAENTKTAVLLSRERIPKEEFFSYMFIPLSSIMFPHIAIMCMTAERVTHFKKTVALYPLCIAAIWIPSVYLGVVAAGQGWNILPTEADDAIPRLLRENVDVFVAGALGAGIMACVMASDSQILALCTMFTEDIFAYYGGKDRFGEKVQVWTGRAFVVLVTLGAYLIALALQKEANIFELAIRFAFTGFAALAPIMLAALFWKRSTKWGAFAAALWVALTMLGTWYLHNATEAQALEQLKPGQTFQIYPALGDMFLRSRPPGTVTMWGFLPVMFITLGSAFWMILVSLLTRPPGEATLQKYFPAKKAAQAAHNGTAK